MVEVLLLGVLACTVPSLWDPLKARGRGANHVVPQPGAPFSHKILLECQKKPGEARFLLKDHDDRIRNQLKVIGDAIKKG